MPLQEQIKNYYFEHLDELPEDKRFHFASRLAAWDGDQRANTALARLESYMTHDGDVQSALQTILQSPTRKVYGFEIRQAYFDKYPRLFGIHDALFRVRHLKEIYGIDARAELLNIVGKDSFEQLYEQLIEDVDALRILSRFAVDFLMLYEILFERPQRLDSERLLEIAEGYDLNDNTQIHLMIYLFTHSIIADSLFYARDVPAERLDVYLRMLKRIEQVLMQQKNIKLDTTYEFMVASRIIHYDSPAFQNIIDAASTHISPSGTFIIDPANGGPQAGINNFQRSEHRNVLFIMANSAYNPKPILLK